MSTRLQISIDAVNALPFDELLSFSNSHTQAAVLSRLSPGRRDALIQEVEEAIKNLETRICGVHCDFPPTAFLVFEQSENYKGECSVSKQSYSSFLRGVRKLDAVIFPVVIR